MSNKSKGSKRYGNPAKRKLVAGDLNKLVQPTGVADPRKLGGSIIGSGGSRDQGAVLLDFTDVVLLESMDVCTIDTVRGGALNEQAIFMTLQGRINKTKDRVQAGFVFGPDGAAGLITELLALADRFGAELLSDLTQRLISLHQGKHVDLQFLKAAIDLALEAENEDLPSVQKEDL